MATKYKRGPRYSQGSPVVGLLAPSDEMAHELIARTLPHKGNLRDLSATLDRLSLLPWGFSRLTELGFALPPSFVEAADSRRRQYEEVGLVMERVLTAVLMANVRAGVTALPVKGPAMARRLHGDPGLRISGDLDLLVRRSQLEECLQVLNALGWTELRRTQNGFPHPLHVRAENPAGGFPIEVHWRLHWHDDVFSEDVVGRSSGSLAAEPSTGDELLMLILVFARDGCVTTRLLVDIRAWYRCYGDDGGTTVASAAVRYPKLARLLTVAEAIIRRRLSMPPAPVRDRPTVAEACARTIALAPPSRSRDQRRAEATAIDVLLAADGERLRVARLAAALGRSELDQAPDLGLHLGAKLHPAKTIARATYGVARGSLAGALHATPSGRGAGG